MLLEKIILTPNMEEIGLLNLIPSFIYFKNNHLKYISANESFKNTLLLSNKPLYTKSDFDFFNKEDAIKLQNDDLIVLKSKKPLNNIKHQLTLPCGKKIWISKSITPFYDEHSVIKGVVGIMTDITHHIEIEEKLHNLAYYDSLTQLPNRTFIMEKIKNNLVNNNNFSILFIDLDRFKFINDTAGHNVGDEYLKFIGNILKETITRNDTVGRLGGDEFIILLDNIYIKSTIEKICKKLLEAINKPWKYNENEFHITASIGIAISRKDGYDVNILLKHADEAMYYVKAHNKNGYKFYSPNLNQANIDQICLEKKWENY